MNEDDFRERFHGALGEPDPTAAQRLEARVLDRPEPTRERTYPRGMALVAGGIALLVLGSLLVPRFVAAARRSAPPAHLTPAVQPAGASTGGPLSCALPLIVIDSRQAASTAAVDPRTAYPTVSPAETGGFVRLSTGEFRPDPSARADGMPFDQMYVRETWQPTTYDPGLRRWLPVGPRAVSPDHRSYAYVVYSPLATAKGSRFDSSTLHQYDVTTKRDRTLWTYQGDINVDRWTAAGIAVVTVPVGGGQPQAWLVDPASGAVTSQGAAPFMNVPDLRAYGLRTGGGFGTDGQGRPILMEGSRTPGASYSYFIGGPNGQRIVIHSGTMGDAFDFDPDGFFVDGDRLWAANHDGTAIWLWTQSDGLQRFPLHAGPQHNMYVDYRVAGPPPTGCPMGGGHASR